MTLDEINRSARQETLNHNREQSLVTNYAALEGAKELRKRQREQGKNIAAENRWWREQMGQADRGGDDEMEKTAMGDIIETHHHHPRSNLGPILAASLMGLVVPATAAIVMGPALIDAWNDGKGDPAPVSQPVEQGVDTVIQPGLRFFDGEDQ